MASNWSTFRSTLEAKLGVPNQLSISELADIHATEYVAAVKEAAIILTSSKATIGISKSAVKSAYEAAFTNLQSENDELTPDYKGNNPNPNAENSKNKIEDIFAPVAAVICAEWAKEIFTPGTVPPGYVAPTVGYVVAVPGDPSALKKDLAKAFYIAQTETDQNTAFNVFVAALILAYTKHLLKIAGTFTGLIPAAPAPVPGPPFPFIAIA